MKLKLIHIPVFFIVTFVLSELLIGQSFMYWDSNFNPITLASITSKDQVSEGESTVQLNLNGDAEISADNSSAAQLSSATDTLFTEYKLTFDGAGIRKTGGPGTDYQPYDQFLTTPASVIYKNNDDKCQVTLHIRASSYSNDVPDTGTYTATQTLTVHWLGP